MRRIRALLIASTALSVAAPAIAEAPARKGARLTWVRGIGADRCVGRLGLEEDVKARLGYDPFALPSGVAIEGTAVRATAGFRAELVVRDARGTVLGTRQLASKEPDCRSLGEAIAVAITVAIEPDAPGTRAESVEEIPPAATPDRPAAPPPLPVTPDRIRGRAVVTVGACAGLVPEIAPVTSLRARADVTRAFAIGLGAHFWPESRASGLGFSLASGSLDACIAPLSVVRAIGWCASVHGGAFQSFVHAAELSPVEVGMFPWAAVETGPTLSLPLGRLVRLEASVSAFAPILRRQAFVRGRGEPVWEQGVVAGRADVGLGAAF